MGWLSETGVYELKSAPDLRKYGLSRSMSRTFEEHLPGE